MRDAGIPGGGYPEKVIQVFQEFAPDVPYLQDTSSDPDVLEAILRTGRLPCVTYNGHDLHYGNQSIAHMVCLPYRFSQGAEGEGYLLADEPGSRP